MGNPRKYTEQVAAQTKTGRATRTLERRGRPARFGARGQRASGRRVHSGGDGLAVVNAAIYGGGILANPQGATKYAYRDAPTAVLEAVATMDKACREVGTDLATAALRGSVDTPEVAGTVVGISKPARVDALLEAMDADLPDELLNRLGSLLPQEQHWVEGTKETT